MPDARSSATLLIRLPNVAGPCALLPAEAVLTRLKMMLTGAS